MTSQITSMGASITGKLIQMELFAYDKVHLLIEIDGSLQTKSVRRSHLKSWCDAHQLNYWYLLNRKIILRFDGHKFYYLEELVAE